MKKAIAFAVVCGAFAAYASTFVEPTKARLQSRIATIDAAVEAASK